MISNISNTLPNLLKKMKDNNSDLNPNGLKYNTIDTINFFNSILPNKKTMNCLKHMYLDCLFVLNDEYKNACNSFAITLDTNEFLKDFNYEIYKDDGIIIIRGNYEDLAILSLILIGSIKNLKNEIKTPNQSIFISLAFHFMKFCLDNGYKVCESSDIKYLEDYNQGFDKKMFKSIAFSPTPENKIGTIHFVGIELNNDILSIFEKYKNVKFTYNNENASYIITMAANYWDDFWNNAPQYLKNEFSDSSTQKIDVR